jgi:glutathione S-transferase
LTALIVTELIAEFTKLNPLQLVPVLEIDDVKLVDSIAILQVFPYTLQI